MAESRPRAADLVVVVNGFPRLSETFVLQELLELERQGARLHLIAIRRPQELVQLQGVERLQAEVEYLPDLGPEAPARGLRMRLRVAHAALCLDAPKRYLNALGEIGSSPDFSRLALRRSVLLAHRLLQLGSPPLYVHWAHKPATIARFAARLAGGPTPIELVYHGVDTDVLAPPDTSPTDPVILSVGRLVEKKGYPTLLRAAATLRDRSVRFRLRIAGDGPQWAVLQRLV